MTQRITWSTLRGELQAINEVEAPGADVLTRLYGAGSLDIRRAGDAYSIVYRVTDGDTTANVSSPLWVGSLRECYAYLRGRSDVPVAGRVRS